MSTADPTMTDDNMAEFFRNCIPPEEIHVSCVRAGADDEPFQGWRITASRQGDPDSVYTSRLSNPESELARQWFIREFAEKLQVDPVTLFYVDGKIIEGCDAYLTTSETPTDPNDGRFHISVVTSADLDAATFNTEYFVPYLLAKSEPAIVAAPQKSLKTSLMGADLLLSIAFGDRFAGYFEAGAPHRVLFMSGESGFSTLQETARRICASKGRELRDATNMLWSEQLPQFGSVAHIEETRRVIRDNGVQLLAIDPCYLSMPGADAGNLFIQGGMMRDMAFMVREENCSLLLIHHTKNVPPQRAHEPLELSDIAWAGFQEFARQWFLINRRKPYDPDSNGEHYLWLNVGSSAGHGGLWGVNIIEGRRSASTARFWDISVCKGADARQTLVEEEQAHRTNRREADRAAAVDSAYEKILQAFVYFPEGATKRRVRERIGQLRAFDEAWAKACNSGDLVECRVRAGNGQEYDGFRRRYDPENGTGCTGCNQ